jgi:hypothetical protein
MSEDLNENLFKDGRVSEYQKERNITNSRKNRSFIDNILKSNDEHAIKQLFGEYFYLHAEKYNNNRITWDDLRLIINEVLQRNSDELILSEATNLFYQIYQLQYPSFTTPTPIKKEDKQLFLKKAKSEQELVSKPKQDNASTNNKKTKNH